MDASILMEGAKRLRRRAGGLRGYATKREWQGDSFDALAIREMADDEIRAAEKLESKACEIQNKANPMLSFRIEIRCRTRRGNMSKVTVNVNATDYKQAYAFARDYVASNYRPLKIDGGRSIGAAIPSDATIPGVEKA